MASAGPQWGRWRAGAIAALAATIGLVSYASRLEVPILDWFDLGVHEAGHIVASFLPRLVMFMAGSVAQVALPLGFAAYFALRRRDLASAGFCVAWAGTSARDVSIYVADAPIQALPLVGGGTHDWAWILGYFDALHRSVGVARAVEFAGLAMVVAGVGLAVWPALFPRWARGEVGQDDGRPRPPPPPPLGWCTPDRERCDSGRPER